jgi:protocatechuate 3,4-dioxygenase beta subunit
MTDDKAITRRGALARLGAMATVLAAGGWAEASQATAGSGPAAVASGQVTCVLTPELTEGPYYIPKEKLRRNITEGRPGAPLALHLAVVDASTCRAIRNAAVDIWHCDAGGVYSGFGGATSERTFMRGIQRTDAKGIAVFDTVYPGWYMGRAVHVHLKVHLGGRVVHTGQLFFPDALTDAVYRQKPYSTRPGPDVRNAADSIYRNGGSKSVLRLSKARAGYVGSITMGVHSF